jgi:hypothetical protein
MRRGQSFISGVGETRTPTMSRRNAPGTVPNRSGGAGSVLMSAALCLLAGSAHAVPNVTIDISHLADWDPIERVYRATVALSPQDWVSFSQNCPGVENAVSCNVGGQPQPSDQGMLFSWGTLEYTAAPGKGRNSWLQVNFGGGVDFHLDTVAFKTVDTTPNLGPVAGPKGSGLSQTQGTGTMLAYERSNPPDLLNQHRVTDQRMSMYANHRVDPILGNSGTAIVDSWRVAADQGAPNNTNASLYDQNGGIADFRLNEDRTFFFTQSGLAADVNNPNGIDVINDPSGGQNTSVRFQTGDTLHFQFYEGEVLPNFTLVDLWNNRSIVAADPPAPPDAYYGSFDIIIKPLASSLSVQNDANQEAGIAFGTARAGDTTVAASLTARNSGANNTTLGGVTFADDLTGAMASYFAPNPASGAGPEDLIRNNLGVSETLARSYSAAGFDFADVAFGDVVGGVTINAGEAQQIVTAGDDFDPNVPLVATRDLMATIKSPILGVAKQTDNPHTGSPEDWADYGSTIDLGDYSIGGPDMISNLIIANIFGVADADFTQLTFFNVGISPDPGGLFSIDGGNPAGEVVQAQLTATNPLGIRFRSLADLPFWTATLSFWTDQNSKFGVQNSSAFTFTLRVDNSGFAPAPAPSVVALIVVGLLAMGALRRRPA